MNDEPIPRHALIDLLIRSFGVSTLQQLIDLELVTSAAAQRGIEVTAEEVAAERERMLRQLADPLADVAAVPMDPQAAEMLLETVLAERNLPKEMFDLLTRRNAYLRKLAEADLDLSERQIDEEYQRRYGRRVQVRHIQLATLAQVQRVRERLQAGEDFASLADRYSAHRAGAEHGGLLSPFAEQDDGVPDLFRQTAFSLEPGQVSNAIRVGEWYHLIRVEKFFPPDQRDFSAVRVEVEELLRARLAEPRMAGLLEDLHRDATIDVLDSALARDFARKKQQTGR